jgi:hypothetical protein
MGTSVNFARCSGEPGDEIVDGGQGLDDVFIRTHGEAGRSVPGDHF